MQKEKRNIINSLISNSDDQESSDEGVFTKL